MSHPRSDTSYQIDTFDIVTQTAKYKFLFLPQWDEYFSHALDLEKLRFRIANAIVTKVNPATNSPDLSKRQYSYHIVKIIRSSNGEFKQPDNGNNGISILFTDDTGSNRKELFISDSQAIENQNVSQLNRQQSQRITLTMPQDQPDLVHATYINCDTVLQKWKQVQETRTRRQKTGEDQYNFSRDAFAKLHQELKPITEKKQELSADDSEVLADDYLDQSISTLTSLESEYAEYNKMIDDEKSSLQKSLDKLREYKLDIEPQLLQELTNEIKEKSGSNLFNFRNVLSRLSITPSDLIQSKKNINTQKGTRQDLIQQYQHLAQRISANEQQVAQLNASLQLALQKTAQMCLRVWSNNDPFLRANITVQFNKIFEGIAELKTDIGDNLVLFFTPFTKSILGKNGLLQQLVLKLNELERKIATKRDDNVKGIDAGAAVFLKGFIAAIVNQQLEPHKAPILLNIDDQNNQITSPQDDATLTIMRSWVKAIDSDTKALRDKITNLVKDKSKITETLTLMSTEIIRTRSRLRKITSLFGDKQTSLQSRIKEEEARLTVLTTIKQAEQKADQELQQLRTEFHSLTVKSDFQSAISMLIEHKGHIDAALTSIGPDFVSSNITPTLDALNKKMHKYKIKLANTSSENVSEDSSSDSTSVAEPRSPDSSASHQSAKQPSNESKAKAISIQMEIYDRALKGYEQVQRICEMADSKIQNLLHDVNKYLYAAELMQYLVKTAGEIDAKLLSLESSNEYKDSAAFERDLGDLIQLNEGYGAKALEYGSMQEYSSDFLESCHAIVVGYRTRVERITENLNQLKSKERSSDLLTEVKALEAKVDLLYIDVKEPEDVMKKYGELLVAASQVVTANSAKINVAFSAYSALLQDFVSNNIEPAAAKYNDAEQKFEGMKNELEQLQTRIQQSGAANPEIHPMIQQLQEKLNTYLTAIKEHIKSVAFIKKAIDNNLPETEFPDYLKGPEKRENWFLSQQNITTKKDALTQRYREMIARLKVVLPKKQDSKNSAWMNELIETLYNKEVIQLSPIEQFKLHIIPLVNKYLGNKFSEKNKFQQNPKEFYFLCAIKLIEYPEKVNPIIPNDARITDMFVKVNDFYSLGQKYFEKQLQLYKSEEKEMSAAQEATAQRYKDILDCINRAHILDQSQQKLWQIQLSRILKNNERLSPMELVDKKIVPFVRQCLTDNSQFQLDAPDKQFLSGIIILCSVKDDQAANIRQEFGDRAKIIEKGKQYIRSNLTVVKGPKK